MKSRKKGFTLVELLVVIGIIALLISILLPSLNRARNAAMNVTCQSNLRQLYLATVMYASENKEFLPLPQGAAGAIARIKEEQYATLNFSIWYNALPRYLNQKPMGGGGRVRNFSYAAADIGKFQSDLGNTKSIFVCSAAAGKAGIALRRTYAMNECLSQVGISPKIPWASHGGSNFPVKAQFYKAVPRYESFGNSVNWTSIPLFTDGYWVDDGTGDLNFGPVRSINVAGSNWNKSDLPLSRPHTGNSAGEQLRNGAPFQSVLYPMKPGGINAVFIDGHVEQQQVQGVSNSNGTFNLLDSPMWTSAPDGSLCMVW